MTQLTDEQIKLGMEKLAGFCRAADIQVVKISGGTDEDLAAYIWDHCLGEPVKPTCSQILRELRRIIRKGWSYDTRPRQDS